MTTLTITRPDDWHVHLRDGDALQRTTSDTARYMGRAIVMPNLAPPITQASHAQAYKTRIMNAQEHCPRQFEPLMVLYLTDNTTPNDIIQAKETGLVAAKLYPAGATTHADAGVSDIHKLYKVFETMQETGLYLLLHGEVNDEQTDIFDRESLFIHEVLTPLAAAFPNLYIVLEHITTEDAVHYIQEASSRVGATITAHHLLLNRNHLLAGGIRPHYYCLPVLKRRKHQQALLAAATSGHPRFFLGTDSAPHSRQRKEAACGCAGCYSAFAAIELYAEAFEQADALDKLNDFASHFGPAFYGLSPNSDTITLRKAPWNIPESLALGGNDNVIPLYAGQMLQWRFIGNE